MPAEPIRLGPFVGGLNTFSDPTAIGDTELAVCDNFDLDIDGSLVSRPPIQDMLVDMPGTATYTTLRTNLASNPHPVSNQTYWNFQHGTGEATAALVVNTTPGAGPEGRTGFLRRTVTTAKTGGLSGWFVRDTTVSGVAGDVRIMSIWVQYPIDVTVQLTAQYRAGGVAIGSSFTSSQNIVANTWTRLSVVGAASATYDAVQVWAQLPVASIIPVGGSYDNTDVLVEAGNTLLPFFYGDSVSTDPQYSYQWTGTANNSTSIYRMRTSSSTMKLLGYFTNSGGASFLVGSNDTGTYSFNGNSWALITNTFAAAAIAQYRDNAWLVAPPGSSNPGGKWDGSTFTAVPAMPKGATIAVQKERLWIGPGKNVTTNGSRIYFCPAAQPDTWNGDFISVNTGDGQNVLEIVVYFQDLLIFKNDSTYRFSYTLDPATGTIARVSDTVGCLDTGCVTSFENRIFVLHDNNLFELSNYNYERLNDKVPFMRSGTVGTYAVQAGISYFSNRIFVSFYGSTYVWSVKTRAWATWSSTVLGAMGRVFSVPNQQAVDPIAYTQSALISTVRIYSITDIVGANTENMTCTMMTKNYDYQTAASFKRLTMWGADVIARGDVSATVTPVQYSSQITWGQAKLRTWGTAKQFTWGRGADISYTKNDFVGIQGTTGERKFIKLGPLSLRFRQIGFTLQIKTDGSVLTAPVRVFNLVTWVREKQAVVKKVS